MCGDGIDLPVLRSASFGFESFRDNPNVVFESVLWECGVMEQTCLVYRHLISVPTHSVIVFKFSLRVWLGR